MRVAKKHDERLNELLDAGEVLFIQKGYEKTTVNDILEAVGIGKGTFYHYFKSKEEVMDGVILRVVERLAEHSKSIARDASLTPGQKFARIILWGKNETGSKTAMITELHQVENARMHQKSIVETIKALVPILTDVIDEGVEQDIFHTPYPRETIEMLLVANQFLFDSGIFHWEPVEILKKAEAFVYSMELLLGTAPGAFGYILEHYKNELKESLHE